MEERRPCWIMWAYISICTINPIPNNKPPPLITATRCFGISRRRREKILAFHKGGEGILMKIGLPDDISGLKINKGGGRSYSE